MCAQNLEFLVTVSREFHEKLFSPDAILRLIGTKFNFGWGSAPCPAGGACSSPSDPFGEGKERKWNWKWKKRDRKRVRWRGEEREGEKGRERIGFSTVSSCY